MLQPKQPIITAQEYLAGERISPIRHQLIDGHVYAMTGTTVRHNRIAGDLYNLINTHLQAENSPCDVFMENVKVQTGENYYYPDLFVDCSASDEDYVSTTPILIVEVLSKSTRQLDETIKLTDYTTKIPGLLEYLLIEQDVVDVEVLRKSKNWKPQHFFMGDQFELESIGATIAVADIYRRVNIEDVTNWLQQQAELATDPVNDKTNQ